MPFKVLDIIDEYPVTLAVAKTHLRYLQSNEDASIEAYIKASLNYGENRMWRKITRAQLLFTMDKFPDSPVEIELPRPPLIEVQSVKYLDNNGTLQTWDASKYDVDSVSTPARIRPKQNESYPSTGEYLNAVQITYTCGYAIADIPSEITQAIQMMTAYYFNNRESVIVTQGSVTVTEAPMSANLLFDMNSVRKP